MTVPSHRAVVRPMALQAILRKITETLAFELVSPTQIAPDWSDFEWRIARAVAAMHGVSPLLSRRLRWRGPDGWMRFLGEQRSHTAKRQARIEELLRLIDQRARDTGIPAVALKGAALHAMALYEIGDRPMADIDLLVRPADAKCTARMLESLGFHESRAGWKERAFTPIVAHDPCGLGENSANDLKIELHERICERLPQRITDVSEMIFPPEPRPGLNAYPSKSSLMMHLMLHAAGSMAFQSLRLIQLQDLARLSSKMAEEDWDALVKSSPRGEGLWWAVPPLTLTSRYFPGSIPDSFLRALTGDCPYLLDRKYRRRMLYDVSYSYLWVDAFPGIEWSRSFREIVDYAASRIWPSAGQLALRDHIANTEVWAPESDRWLHLSQSRRILRWIISRPTRPVTMRAVAAALVQAQ